jgi:NitT/TauT family transport system permease protein/taurine transport system permease protein
MRPQQAGAPGQTAQAGALAAPLTRSGAAALALRSRPVLSALFYSVGPFAALVAVWAIVVAVWHLAPAVLPSPLRVAEEIAYTVRSGILPDFVQRSLARLLLTAAAVIPMGVMVGMVVGLVRPAAATLMPLFRYLTAIPAIAWLPVFLVTLGFNETSIVATAAYGFFFPVLFNTLVGVQTVPRVLRSAIRTLGGTGYHVIRDVLVPGALPSIAAGMRLGFAYGWRALIAAEMLVAQGGLGHMLFRAQSVGFTPRMVAGMAVIGTLAAAVDFFVMEPLEERTVRRWGTVRP